MASAGRAPAPPLKGPRAAGRRGPAQPLDGLPRRRPYVPRAAARTYPASPLKYAPHGRLDAGGAPRLLLEVPQAALFPVGFLSRAAAHSPSTYSSIGDASQPESDRP
jgi:hypothetical protein